MTDTQLFFWWQCPGCLWFDWGNVNDQPLCLSCQKHMMLARGQPFRLSDEDVKRLPHTPLPDRQPAKSLPEQAG